MMRWLLLLVMVAWAGTAFGQSLEAQPAPKQGIPRLESRLARLTLSSPAAKPAPLPLGVKTTGDGKLVVIVEPPPGEEASAIDLVSLEGVGAEILAQSRHLVRVAIPARELIAATQVAGVHFIRPPMRPSANAVTSEGVALIAADAYHTNGLLGKGIKVAVLDEGFTDASDLGQDIPRTHRVRDFTGTGIYSGGPHGTACAEIIHDIAPEAGLYLLRVDDLVGLENAKDYCIREGIDIVSHSMAWLGTGFGDGRGLACEIVDDATDNGVLWVNSAGNYAERQYTGLWADSDANAWHDIFGAENEILHLSEVAVGDTIEVWLTWNDWPTSSQNYDFYLYRWDADNELEEVAKSTTVQVRSEPVESIWHEVVEGGTYGLAVWKAESARGTVIKLWSGNHDLAEHASLIGNIGTPADASGALAVGAISHYDWRSGRIAPYSSLGPTADGRIKPDLVAPSGVSTASYGSSGFGGTSAAAPHVAGASALLLSAEPTTTAAELVDVLLASAVDEGDRGADNTFGHGKVVLSPPPRFNTELHFVWDGWLEIGDGRVSASKRTWRFSTYQPSEDGILVTGICQMTVTNATSHPQRMYSSIAFLGADGAEVADRFIPDDWEIDLIPDEPQEVSVEFSVAFSGLAAADAVERVVFFSSFEEIVSPPVAAFAASTLSGVAPLTVTFTDQSTGTVDSYFWFFGDRASSRIASPSHTYSSAGTYSVRFTVTNKAGTDTATKTITVTEPPSGHLLVRGVVGIQTSESPMSVTVNRRVRFEVLRYGRDDRSDTVAVTGFTMDIPPTLGSAAGADQIRVTTVAGVTRTVQITAEGVTADFQIETLPGTVVHLRIEPQEAPVLLSGQQLDFDAEGVDKYGNVFALSGVGVGWQCVPAEIGTIHSRTGLFTAGDAGGVGYVVAVVARSLRSGYAGAVSQGTGKITVQSLVPKQFALTRTIPIPSTPRPR